MKSVYVIYLFAIILSFNFMNTEQINDYKQEKVSVIIDYLKILKALWTRFSF